MWLSCWAPGAVGSGTVSSWSHLHPVLQRSAFAGARLFNIFVSDQGDGTKCSHSQFANKTTPGAVPGAWADSNLVQLNLGKGLVLHLGGNSPRHQQRLGARSWRAAWQERT